MFCNFQSLHLSGDGYVVLCKQCGCYQVAFISTLFTLTETELTELQQRVLYCCEQPEYMFSADSKSVVINIGASDINMILSKNELLRFRDILEQAVDEARALELISLFNPETNA